MKKNPFCSIFNFLFVAFLLLFISCSRTGNNNFFDAGVSKQLAQYRNTVITNLTYNLSFTIPDILTSPIPGNATITFDLSQVKKPVLLDFRTPEGYLKKVSVNNHDIAPEVKNDHIILLKRFLKKGQNTVILSFRTGDLSLNRNDDYLYTLFVPDRASTAFPCFDQPDLKACFNLTLNIPSSWEAISNNPVIRMDTMDGRKIIEYTRGEKISTYLFAFAAGKFQRIEKEIGGIKIEMLHRETRKESLASNVDEIFRLHYNAIRWLEDYTGIKYPFPKFGFVLIPTFQYSGMEHPGAICYRASGLLLDESPTLNEQLSRASLIAHETSHIWFGDLVTMKWFDDVWLKEVFAGYFSDKIVSPDFPSINNDLRFLLSRYPAAYAVDRTKGSNPIIQKLDNMKDAGSLYGNIIYNKAPVVMKHLSQITGEEGLRNSLRVYLHRFSYGNAEWDDLINIIEENTSKPLKEWSHVWVREAGMPTITPKINRKKNGSDVCFSESDPAAKDRHWPQTMVTKVITSEGIFYGNSIPGDTTHVIETSGELLCIIPDTTGTAYGYFVADSITINYLKNNIASFRDPVVRGTIWINLYENLLNGAIAPETFYLMISEALQSETDIQLQAYLTGRLSSLFWDHFGATERSKYGKEIEDFAWKKVSEASAASIRKTWFILFRSISMSNDALSKLYSVWESGKLPGDVKLGEEELCSLAFNLALKEYPGSDSIIVHQYNRISNDDRKKRFAFVTPALSVDPTVRDAFFESLREPGNREHEPWVLEALGYLHHPLRAESSEKYILPSLEMLEEIKTTGDIFFPGNWITTTLSGHHSGEAKKTVEDFLSSHPSYPEDLRLKILQAADQILR
jgi:aminopeptidase N